MSVKLNNPLFEKLGMKYPIIQGGMAWAGTGHLAGAVSEAGGLGIIGTGYWKADKVREEIRRAREVTDKPFGVNVMLLSRHIREVFDVIIEEGVKVVATGAGDPSPFIEELHSHDILVIPVVPSVGLAKMMEKKGVDAVVAEGMESGGHIGMLTTMTLVPQVVDALKIPVIAAGGIADGRGMAAAFALGAKAVQMGTRFVLSEECIAHENYKNAVLKAKDRATVMTGLTTGHPVRIIDNALAHKYKSLEFSGGSKEELEALGAGTLRLAAIDGNVKEGSVMIGQISGMLTDVKPCETIIKDIMTEAETVIKNLQGLSK